MRPTSGADPYAMFLANWRTNMAANLGFDYLPIVATLARPLAALPQPVAQMLWLWWILGCTVAASVLTARSVLPASWPRTAIGVAAGVLFAPGPLQPLARSDERRRPAQPGGRAAAPGSAATRSPAELALGLGGVAKLAPPALLLLLLARRWWRGAAAGGGVAVLALVGGILTLGMQRTVEWVTQVLPALERADGWYFNQSLGGVISRLVDHSVWHVQPTLPLLQAAVTLALRRMPAGRRGDGAGSR